MKTWEVLLLCRIYWVESSKVTAASPVAYTEAKAAFARRFRETAFTRDEYKVLKASF
jgi:hypothetical protein